MLCGYKYKAAGKQACNNNNNKKSIKKNRSVLFVCKKNPRHHCRLTGVDDRGHTTTWQQGGVYKPGMGGRLLFLLLAYIGKRERETRTRRGG